MEVTECAMASVEVIKRDGETAFAMARNGVLHSKPASGIVMAHMDV